MTTSTVLFRFSTLLLLLPLRRRRILLPAILLASALTRTTSFGDAFRSRTARLPAARAKRVAREATTTTTASASVVSLRCQGDDRREPSAKSIGDVVRNLHGGKYQFSSEAQYLAGNSATGRAFAESLYSGGGDDDDDAAEAGDDGELPKWALRLKDPGAVPTSSASGELVFDDENAMHSIRIKNEERSWERYYAFVLRTDGEDGDGHFRVSPTTGTLAPRGGASNACDETKPYSDGATITVERVAGAAGGGGDARKEERRLLVVGTEAEVWRYRLSIA